METRTIETTLRFVGEWPWWLGALVALILGALAWVFYRRDVRTLRTALRIVLPALRASAIAMAALMLTGPVLHHREIIGELSTIRLLVDGSKSMQLTDPAMDPVRKVLILQRMNLLPADAIPMDLPQAADALAKAETLAQQGAESGGATIVDWKKHASDFAARIGEARERLAQAGGDATRLERFGSELYDPSAQFATEDFAITGEQRQKQSAALGRLGDVTRRWRQEISAAFQQMLDASETNGGSPLREAIEKFDALGRWERVQSMLLGGEPQTFLARLTEHHDLHLIVLHEGEAKEVWHPRSKNSTPPSALPKPAGDATDLGTPVRDGVPGGGRNQRGAIVLFTDGQHNEGASPLEAARILGGQETPIFPIGIGSELRPADIAIIKAEAPESVFFEDRIRGELTLKDDLRQGQPFTIRISDGDKVVWEQAFRSENRQARKVPFDFAVKSLVESRLGANSRADVRVAAIPVELKIAVSHVEGDREPGNNAASLRFRAITQKRKILIVDGRPRWETRYIRNLFERDEQWEVTAVIAGSKAGDPGLPRGNNPDQFPTDSGLLDTYDLIVFGEVPASLWKGGELKWIADFVGQRGGALILIDGSRGYLRGYDATPLAPLIPVQLQSGGGRNEPLAAMHLTELGKARASLSLAADPAQNLPLWENLPPPHTAAKSAALPGAEVLLEGETRTATKVPLIVQRPFGAGKVLYHAFDESWRWRYEAADEHHVRYWNQMATWIAEIPFAVRDKFVSLDAGAVTYRPGESAEIRVRLRDGEGKPVTNAAVDALLHREGKKMATIRLAPDENSGGLYRGKTATLAPGDYEVAIHSVAIAERDTKARTAFKVEQRATGELTLLNLNEDLLRKVAALSGGHYLREEHIDKLTDLLTPLSQGKVIESETALWQSYWWFGPLVGLLTIEWIIRKRAGLL